MSRPGAEEGMHQGEKSGGVFIDFFYKRYQTFIPMHGVLDVMHVIVFVSYAVSTSGAVLSWSELDRASRSQTRPLGRFFAQIRNTDHFFSY